MDRHETPAAQSTPSTTSLAGEVIEHLDEGTINQESKRMSDCWKSKVGNLCRKSLRYLTKEYKKAGIFGAIALILTIYSTCRGTKGETLPKGVIPERLSQYITEHLDVNIYTISSSSFDSILNLKIKTYELIKKTVDHSNDDDGIYKKNIQAVRTLENGEVEKAALLFESSANYCSVEGIKNINKLNHWQKLAAKCYFLTGLTLSLKRSTDSYKQAIDLIDNARKIVKPLDSDLYYEYSVQSINLSSALVIEFDEGGAVKQVVSQCKSIIESISERNLPIIRGELYTTLGNTLSYLGGLNRKRKFLDEAMNAYNCALETRKRNVLPSEWAATMNNIGITYKIMGGDMLVKAIDAFEKSLEVRTKKSNPIDWASTSNNLANAYRGFGDFKTDIASLEKAVDIFNEVLTVRTRENFPMHWAETKNNLGNALSSIGEIKKDQYRLRQAANAYKDSLQVITKENSPLKWGKTMSNYALANALIGQITEEPREINDSIKIFLEILPIRWSSGDKSGWAETKKCLGDALLALGKITKNSFTLENAIEHFRDSQSVFTEDTDKYRWNIIQEKVHETQKCIVNLHSEAGSYQADTKTENDAESPLNSNSGSL